MQPNAFRLVVPAVGLGGMMLAAFLFRMAPERYHGILQWYGIEPFAYPFFDLEFISSVTDCWKRGVNVYLQNPCDLLGRVHSYSPLWLRATFVPVGYGWTVVMGTTLDTLFFLSIYWVVRPVRWAEAILATVCCCSTMTVFAVERANVDVLFFLFFVASILLDAGRLWSRAIGYALILLAGLLKFYPLAALIVITRERPLWFVTFGVLAAAALAAFVLVFQNELLLMKANIPVDDFAGDMFGATNLPSLVEFAIDAKPSNPAILKPALTVILAAAACAGAIAWTRLPGLRQAYTGLPRRTAATMTIGAALIAGCFLAGQSVGYRGIFLIFVVAGLIELRRLASPQACRRMLGSVAWMIGLLMWEGFFHYALIANGSIGMLAPFLLLRELLWWTLLAFLLAMLALSASGSEAMAWLRRMLPKRSMFI